MDDAVTVRLVGFGNKALQAFDGGGIHRLRESSQQYVSRKIPKRLVFFLDIAGVLSCKLPESFDAAKLADICKDTVCFLAESGGKDCNDDILRRTLAQTGKNRHNVDMELEGCLIVPSDPAQLLNTIFAVKELCIELDRLPHTHPYANIPKSPPKTGLRRRRLCSAGNHKVRPDAVRRRTFGRPA